MQQLERLRYRADSMRKQLSLLLLMLSQAPLANAETVTVQIDLKRTGAPINPFLYGQFIEHLGRSIYGGIWAEMLEDRKFYFPVTDDYAPYKALENSQFPVVGASPWQVIGGPDSVRMVAEESFVGEHTPQVEQGSGIRQHDLGVRDGTDYLGYVWARSAGQEPATLEVALIWGDDAEDRESTRLRFESGDYAKQSFA